MQSYELSIYLDNLEYIDRNSWEQCRLMVWSALAPNSKKKMKLDDVMKFKWDEGIKNTSISNDDIAKLKELSKNYECKFNSKD